MSDSEPVVDLLNAGVQPSIRSRSPHPAEGKDIAPRASLQYDPDSSPAEVIELEAGPSKTNSSKAGSISEAVIIDETSPKSISGVNRNAVRWKARLQFFSVCFCLFVAGWNDGTTGPLLPRIQQVYHVGLDADLCF